MKKGHVSCHVGSGGLPRGRIELGHASRGAAEGDGPDDGSDAVRLNPVFIETFKSGSFRKNKTKQRAQTHPHSHSHTCIYIHIYI